MSERDPWADFEEGMRLVKAQPERPLVVTPELADAIGMAMAKLYGLPPRYLGVRLDIVRVEEGEI